MREKMQWPLLVLYGLLVPAIGGFLVYDGLRRLADVRALRSHGVTTVASVIDIETTIDANSSETTEAIVAFMVDRDPWPQMQTVRFMIGDDGLEQIEDDRLEVVYLPSEPTVIDVAATFPSFAGRDRFMVGFGATMLLGWIFWGVTYLRGTARTRTDDRVAEVFLPRGDPALDSLVRDLTPRSRTPATRCRATARRTSPRR